MPHEVAPEAPRLREVPAPPARPTAAGRVFVGTLLTLGVYLGIRQFVTSLILAVQPDPTAWWLTLRGLSVIYLAQMLAVCAGALIAAAGRTSGYALGFVVGAVCSGLFLAFELYGGAPANQLVLYLQTPILALLGLIAGAVGARVWATAPELVMPDLNPSRLSSLQFATENLVERSRPTNWVRVLVGVMIMVLGVSLAEQTRMAIQKNSAGLLRVETMMQGEFITWQMATFAVLLGGVVAGASTGVGIRQGLIAGALGGLAVLGLCIKLGSALSPIEFWLGRLSLSDLPLTDPPVVVGIVGSILLVGLFGGWLGGTLFLPLARNRPKLRMGMD